MGVKAKVGKLRNLAMLNTDPRFNFATFDGMVLDKRALLLILLIILFSRRFFSANSGMLIGVLISVI